MNIKEKINILLKSKQQGFSGLTHMLIAALMFCLMFIAPLKICKNYVHLISQNKMFLFVVFFITIGSALLPDLDNPDGSTAGFQLSLVGKVLTTGMVSLSFVAYSLIHTGKDKKPISMHRMLFHAPVVPLIIGICFWFLIPASNIKFIDSFRIAMAHKTIPNFLIDNIAPFICIVFTFISSWLAASCILYRLMKLFHNQRFSHILYIIIGLVCTFFAGNLSYTELRFIGLTIALGFFYHIFGDLFSQGSIPILFPIPIMGKFWWKPVFPGQIYTAGIVNKILNIVLIVTDLVVPWVLFWPKR